MFSLNNFKYGVKFSELRKKCNPLQDFLRKHEDLPIDYDGLSKNPNMTWDFLKEMMKTIGVDIWNWHALSVNPSVATWEIVRDNPEVTYPDGDSLVLDWNPTGLSANPNITPNIVEANPEYAWDWREFCHNPSLCVPEFVFAHSQEDWDWTELSLKFDTEIIMGNLGYAWDWEILSERLPIEFIQENSILLWHFDKISENETLTWEFVKQHWNKDWNWDALSANSNVNKPENVNASYKQCPWDWDLLSRFMELNVKFIKKHAKRLDWENLSYNKSLTCEIIIKLIHEPWNWQKLSLYLRVNMTEIQNPILAEKLDWEMLSQNPYVSTLDTIQFFRKQGVPPNWAFLSYRRDITWEFVEEHRHEPLSWWSIVEDPYITANRNIPKIPKEYLPSCSANPGILPQLAYEDFPVYEQVRFINNVCYNRYLYDDRVYSQLRDKRELRRFIAEYDRAVKWSIFDVPNLETEMTLEKYEEMYGQE